MGFRALSQMGHQSKDALTQMGTDTMGALEQICLKTFQALEQMGNAGPCSKRKIYDFLGWRGHYSMIVVKVLHLVLVAHLSTCHEKEINAL